MIEISVWLDLFLTAIDAAFGERVQFVGLQGSYARGEATENSDIDVVLILDTLSAQDIRIYGTVLDGLPHRERICGFLSGKCELLSWEPSDLFQFYYDTKPLRGTLSALCPIPDRAAARRAVSVGACNVYHACVHNMLHEKSTEILHGLYKSAVFTVCAIAFLNAGKYPDTKETLYLAVSPEEKAILDTASLIKTGVEVDFVKASETLFLWAKKWICEGEKP